MFTHWLATLAFVAGSISGLFIPLESPSDPSSTVPEAQTLMLTSNLAVVITSKTIPAGTFGGATVYCPAGMAAVSGGIDVHNVLLMRVTSSGPFYSGTDGRLLSQEDGPNPAPIGWQAYAVNYGSSSAMIKIAVVCSSMTEVSSVVESGTVNAGTFDASAAACPTGSVALGGGIDPENVLTMEITSSGPVFGSTRLLQQPDGAAPAPTRWFGAVVNNADTQKKYKTAVICAPSSSVSAVVGSMSVASGSFNALRVTCPAGSAAIGGGIDPNNVLTSTVTSSAPTFNNPEGRLILQPEGYASEPVGYQASQLNRDTSPMTVKVAAICMVQPKRVYIPLVER